MQSIQYRYQNDPMIKALVDRLVSAIENLELTPSEVRECAMLAAVRHEMYSKKMTLPADRDVVDKMDYAKAAWLFEEFLFANPNVDPKKFNWWCRQRM